MRLRRDGNKLIFEEKSLVIPAVFGAAALLMAWRLWQWTGREGWTIDSIGLAGGTVALAALAILVAGGSRFVFNRATGRLTWRRRMLLKTERGEARLWDIRAVSLAPCTDARGADGWRGVLHMTDGSSLPLTMGANGRQAEWQDILAGIDGYLGLADAAGQTLTERVERMLRAGRRPEAVRLVRLETGLDMAAARAAVDSIGR